MHEINVLPIELFWLFFLLCLESVYKATKERVDKATKERVDNPMEEYLLSEEDIIYVELNFRKDKILLSEFKSNEDLTKIPPINKKKMDRDNKLLNIPISINENSLGKPLSVDIDNNLITNIKIMIDDNVVNFLSLIREKSSYIRKDNPDSIMSFDSGYNFYLVRDENNDLFVLVIKVLNKYSVDKIRYSLSGIVYQVLWWIELKIFLLMMVT